MVKNGIKCHRLTSSNIISKIMSFESVDLSCYTRARQQQAPFPISFPQLPLFINAPFNFPFGFNQPRPNGFGLHPGFFRDAGAPQQPLNDFFRTLLSSFPVANQTIETAGPLQQLNTLLATAQPAQQSNKKIQASSEFRQSFAMERQLLEEPRPNQGLARPSGAAAVSSGSHTYQSRDKSATEHRNYRVESLSGRDCIVLDEIDVEPTNPLLASPLQQPSSSADTAVSRSAPNKTPRNKKSHRAKKLQIQKSVPVQKQEDSTKEVRRSKQIRKVVTGLRTVKTRLKRELAYMQENPATPTVPQQKKEPQEAQLPELIINHQERTLWKSQLIQSLKARMITKPVESALSETLSSRMLSEQPQIA